MVVAPLYSAKVGEPAYRLRYTWTGWPSSGDLPGVDLEEIKPLWESDGLRLLESRRTPRDVQLAFARAGQNLGRRLLRWDVQRVRFWSDPCRDSKNARAVAANLIHHPHEVGGVYALPVLAQ